MIVSGLSVRAGVFLAAAALPVCASRAQKAEPAKPAQPAPQVATQPTPPSASPGASKGDLITLQDGRAITAPILKETSEKLWLDLGFTVVEVPRAQVESIVRAKPDEALVESKKGDLFRIAKNMPERSP